MKVKREECSEKLDAFAFLPFFRSSKECKQKVYYSSPDQKVSLDWSRNSPRPLAGGPSKQAHIANSLRTLPNWSKQWKEGT